MTGDRDNLYAAGARPDAADRRRQVVIIGAGPAGLMAAERLAAAGCAVTVYERKPSAARKFLMAGRGGLNLTHGEEREQFVARYGAAAAWMGPLVADFTPQDLRDWAAGLGEETFIGSSGRVFPRSFKASPLLRAWLGRLAASGVRIEYGWDWRGWDAAGRVVLAGADGQERAITPAALLLALGGASWPRLGADGGWTGILAARGVEIAPLRPANCGFTVTWSPLFARDFAGQPLKNVIFTYDGRHVRGEAMITARGIEGGAIYALAASLRDGIARDGRAVLAVDLRPDVAAARLAARLAGRGRMSLGAALRKRAGLAPVMAALWREDSAGGVIGTDGRSNEALAARIKALPLLLRAPFGMERAISSAGGVARAALDDGLMVRGLPGVFVAGEMIDWEAPTGGYLLQGCFATAVRAARGIVDFCA